MMSRRECRELAQAWVINQGIAEYERRMLSIEKQDAEYKTLAREIGRPFTVDQQKRAELLQEAAHLLVHGYYDPPLPHIPCLLRRLFMHAWMPPRPTAEQWPMGSDVRGKPRKVACRDVE